MREGETYGSWVWAAESPRGATDQDDRVAKSAAQSSVGLKYLYASRPWSPVVEAYHNRARWYSPEAGRFLTRDPIGYLGGVNQYMYANGNPIGFRDPWGLKAMAEGGALFGALNAWAISFNTENESDAMSGYLRQLAIVGPFILPESEGTSFAAGEWGGLGVGLAGIGTPIWKAGAAVFGRGAARTATATAAATAAPRFSHRLGVLRQLGKDHWESSGGLIYKGTAGDGFNRVQHVLAHTVANANKAKHTVFSDPPNKVLGLLEEAWSLRKAAEVVERGPNTNYIIDMGRVVATTGETRILISVRNDTSEVITASPY